MTKVEDLLRESQEGALNALTKNENIVKMFNLDMTSVDELDDTS